MSPRLPADLFDAELHDQRVGLGALLERDFSNASPAEMVQACQTRIAELPADDFEADLMREFITMLTGRGDGQLRLH